MKFRFRPSAAKRRLKSPEAKRKALRPRGANTLRPIRQKSLAINYRAEDFAPFEEEKSKGRIALAWERFISRFKNRKPRKKSPPLISNATLLGALCSALCLTLISGGIVLFSLFFRYGGRHTEVTVPNLVSMSVDKATDTASDIFEYTIVYEENPEKDAGSVISQSPLPNVVRKLYGRGEKINITLTVNKAPPTMTLPRVIGTQLRDTALNLKNFGVNVQVIEQHSETVPYGTVFFSSLPQGSKLSPGDKIVLKASIGKQTRYAAAPDLFGLSEQEAESLLKAKNLAVGDVKYESSKLPIGTVISQDVAPDTTLREGSKISITVSGGIYYS